MTSDVKSVSGRSAVARILTGSVVGQGVFFAVAPFLTRIYSPEDFSALALVTAFVAVLSSLATLSWERAVVLPSAESDASSIVWLGIFSTFGLSLIFGGLGFFLRSELTTVFGSTVFSVYWWLIPVTTSIVGVYAVLSSWVVRHQQYGTLASRNALVGIGQASASVGLGALGMVPLGLVASLGIGRLISLPGLVGGRHGFRERPPAVSKMLKQASVYRKFPLITSWSRAMNSLGLQLPMILLIALFGSYEAGFVALTMRVLAAPIGLIVDAVSQYFEGVFSARVRARETSLTPLVLSVCRSLALVGVVPAIGVLVFATGLFDLAFGDEWAQAGTLAQILVPVYFLQLVIVPISRSLLILQCQGTQLLWDLSRVVVTSATVVCMYLASAELTAAVAVLAVAQVLLYLVLFVLVLMKVLKWDRIHLT